MILHDISYLLISPSMVSYRHILQELFVRASNPSAMLERLQFQRSHKRCYLPPRIEWLPHWLEKMTAPMKR